ncbi:tetratricopeptide repeat protein [Microbacterium suaedae]|uniref:tetratricopeptide repeat protein n=1 Tax=Microbacterium suaedae TaxID=2067813 RepID=UPI000DA1C1B9|nr:tetratricopeptide repeat protein [Microbacterium suaedae]
MSDASLGSALRGAVDLSSLRNQPPASQPGAPSGGAGAAASSGGEPEVVMHVDDQSFGRVMELSAQYPFVVQLWAEQVPQTVTQGELFERVTRSYGGRIVLARVDASRAPQVTQMFQQNGWPMTIGVIGQRPVPVPDQEYGEEQVRDLFEQILQLAANAGVTGIVAASGEDETPEEPAEPTLPPLHQEAFDAIQRGDYDSAVAAYEKALTENPRDDDAQAGLAQVSLLKRVEGADLQAARQAAADAPGDVDAQLAVADLDMAGGHVDDAFERLLDAFAAQAGDERVRIKDRLLELFGLVGQADPRVVAARTRLTNLLF